MVNTQRLMRMVVWAFVVAIWLSMYVLYAHNTPSSYLLNSANPQIQPLLGNMYQPEIASDDTQYRWSEPESSILWSGLQVGSMAIATVQVADVGRPVSLLIDHYTTTITGRRTVMMLLHDTHINGQQTIELSTPAFTVAGDTRTLGIRLLSVGLLLVNTHTMPLIDQMSVVWLAIMLTSAVYMLWRPYWLLGMIVAPIVSIVLTALNPLHATLWLGGLALTSSVIPIFIYFGRRWIPSALLAVTGAVYLVRLWGVMYPLFAGHDYPIHLRRVFQFSEGIWSLTANPYEFGRRTSVILPLYYRLADILSDILGHHLAMHALIITSETALGIAVWLLVRRAGLGDRTALFAGVLTLLWPISSAVLWWSFMQQITAHVFTILVAYAAVRRDQRGAYMAALFFAIVATMHIGEMMVAALWYGLLRLYEPDIGQGPWWRRLVPVLVLVPFLLPLYTPFLQNLSNGSGGSLVNPDLNEVIPRMVTAVTVAWQPIPVWVAPVVIGFAVWSLKRAGWAWLGVGVTFWLVELITQAQVRYLYTVTPLLATGFAVVLTPVWRKGYAGRLFVVCLIGFVAWVSLALWIDGVMGWQKPRIDGLTH
jgi:hypothetical protein